MFIVGWRGAVARIFHAMMPLSKEGTVLEEAYCFFLQLPHCVPSPPPPPTSLFSAITFCFSLFFFALCSGLAVYENRKPAYQWSGSGHKTANMIHIKVNKFHVISAECSQWRTVYCSFFIKNVTVFQFIGHKKKLDLDADSSKSLNPDSD